MRPAAVFIAAAAATAIGVAFILYGAAHSDDGIKGPMELVATTPNCQVFRRAMAGFQYVYVAQSSDRFPQAYCSITTGR